ncbi:TIGR02117 family protein [Jiella sp. MQZ9-1]|uniref:TIGR02117 family protein n=1 Tax=Jiella flava TaxID=2816857 RepID=A0A939JUM9_9HYPH|nr:TIGR02117 family protein [Jiella flava]MBO0661579.1 TIGR02117 family protein [Jiella flava]MCD2470221.1 TIGR02117 family protein [Jiella flava]
MTARRQIARRIVRGLVAVVVLAALTLALGTLIPRGAALPAARDDDNRRILLLEGPIHTDIALPADDATRVRFGFLTAAGLPVDNPAVAWLVVGWGGKSFYTETPTWSELKARPLLRTLIGDASALHVALAGPIDPNHPGVRAFRLSPEAYRRLLDAILASFVPGPNGAPQPISGTGYGLYDRFFEARGTFQLLANCNSWTAAMLRAGGIRTGLWTPLPQLLFLSLDLHAG